MARRREPLAYCTSALLSGGSAARESPLSHATRAVGLIQLFLDVIEHQDVLDSVLAYTQAR